MTNRNLTIIARPYALAAFESALAQKDLPAWGAMLEMAAAIVRDEKMSRLLRNPSVTSKQLGEFFLDLLTEKLNEERKNFIKLLVENHRLAALPDIALQFNEYSQAHDKSLTVKVRSAIKLDEQHQLKIANALVKKLQKKVTLQCEVDPDILGGVIIQAGDTVIDGSIRNKLNRLLESL